MYGKYRRGMVLDLQPHFQRNNGLWGRLRTGIIRCAFVKSICSRRHWNGQNVCAVNGLKYPLGQAPLHFHKPSGLNLCTMHHFPAGLQEESDTHSIAILASNFVETCWKCYYTWTNAHKFSCDDRMVRCFAHCASTSRAGTLTLVDY